MVLAQADEAGGCVTPIDKNSKLFRDACKARGVSGRNLDLVAAIVTVESTWNPFAYRFEPKLHKRVVQDVTLNTALAMKIAALARAQRFSPDSEVVLQCSSFGLMQILGSTARGEGFDGYLPELFQPEIGLEWGIKHLQLLQARKGYSETDAIAAYNYGHVKKLADGSYANQDYVSKVLAVLA